MPVEETDPVVVVQVLLGQSRLAAIMESVVIEEDDGKLAEFGEGCLEFPERVPLRLGCVTVRRTVHAIEVEQVDTTLEGGEKLDRVTTDVGDLVAEG